MGPTGWPGGAEPPGVGSRWGRPPSATMRVDGPQPYGWTVAEGGGGRAPPTTTTTPPHPPLPGGRVRRYKRLYTFICVQIFYVKFTEFHRYKRLYMLIYVNIRMQILTDIDVYIRLYT